MSARKHVRSILLATLICGMTFMGPTVAYSAEQNGLQEEAVSGEVTSDGSSSQDVSDEEAEGALMPDSSVEAYENEGDLRAEEGETESDAALPPSNATFDEFVDYGEDVASDMVDPQHMWNSPEAGISLLASSPYWRTSGGTKTFYDGNGSKYASSALKVVDVSNWQGKIDWAAVKNSDVDAVILRAGYGVGHLDKSFAYNLEQVRKYGIPYGIYFYSYAYDASFAKSEAEWLAEIMDTYHCDDMSFPAYYDLEAFASWKDGNTLRKHPTSASVYKKIVSSFTSTMANHGYDDVNIYSYRAYLQSELNSPEIWAITSWIAEYNPTLKINNTYYTGQYGWQYTSSGTVPGMGSGIDISAFSDWDYVRVTSLPAVSIPDGTYYINAHLKDSSSVQIASGLQDNGAVTTLGGAQQSASQRFNFARQSDGSYVITNEASGKVLDVKSANAYDGATVQQYTANGTAAQRWFIRDSGAGYYLQSALGNWVLDIASANTADGTSVRLYTPNGSKAQLFMPASAEPAVPVEKTVVIRSAINSNMVADVKSGSSSNGAAIQLYSWNDSDAQVFTLKRVGNGIYQLLNAKTGKVVEVSGGKTSNGSKVAQYASNGTLSQHWSVRDGGNGALVLINCNTGKALDVSGGTATSGKQLQIYSPNGTTAQCWTLTEQETQRVRVDAFAKAHKGTMAAGVYAIGAAGSERQVVDVKNGSTSNSANVQLYASNATNAQRWRITEDKNGYLTIANVKSGKVLDVSGASLSNKANVQQYASNGSYAQKWIAVANSDGTVTFYSALKMNFALDAYGNKTANGTNIDVYASNGTAAQRFRLYRKTSVSSASEVISSGTYVLHASNGKVLDVPSAKKTDGVQLQTYRANESAAQMFVLSFSKEKGAYTLRSLASGRMLDVDKGDCVPGAAVNQWGTSASTSSQRYWVIENAGNAGYVIVSLANGQVLGLSSTGKLVTVPRGDARAITWTFKSAGLPGSRNELDRLAAPQGQVIKNGTYQIAAASSSKMRVDVKGGSKSDSANVQLYASNGSNAQRWTITNLSNGFVRITNVGSGKVLDVKSASATLGANVQQYAWNSSRAQMWLPVRLADGSYLLYSALGNGLVLDVSGGSMKNGANVQIYSWNGSAAQRFMLMS